jgi:hypothetical protein
MAKTQEEAQREFEEMQRKFAEKKRKEAEAAAAAAQKPAEPAPAPKPTPAATPPTTTAKPPAPVAPRAKTRRQVLVDLFVADEVEFVPPEHPWDYQPGEWETATTGRSFPAVLASSGRERIMWFEAFAAFFFIGIAWLGYRRSRVAESRWEKWEVQPRFGATASIPHPPEETPHWRDTAFSLPEPVQPRPEIDPPRATPPEARSSVWSDSIRPAQLDEIALRVAPVPAPPRLPEPPERPPWQARSAPQEAPRVSKVSLYDTLAEDERLLAWRNQRFTSTEIGAVYEEMVAHDLMVAGWSVEYNGIDDGVKDRGIDLTARKGDETLVVQCKCWGKTKLVRENAITQLHGAVCAFMDRNATKKKVKGMLITTTTVDDAARDTANRLGIVLRTEVPLRKDFPRVKVTKEGIYHSPISSPYYFEIRRPVAWFQTTKEARAAGHRPPENLAKRALNGDRQEAPNGAEASAGVPIMEERG